MNNIIHTNEIEKKNNDNKPIAIQWHGYKFI